MAERHRIFVWASANQSDLIRSAIEAADIELAAIGSSEHNDSIRLAEQFDAPRAEDLRQGLNSHEADALWLAEPVEPDLEIIRHARQMHLPILSCLPLPSSLNDLTANPDLAAAVRFCPLMRLSPGVQAAAQVLPDFGHRQCVNIFLRCAAHESALFAREFDAVDMIDSLCGTAEMIDAALAPPSPGVPEALADLHGHLTANMRFPENRCACIAASDQAGAWFRGVTVLGEGGCLRIDDAGFEWIAPDGRIVDSVREKSIQSPGELIGRQIRRMFDEMDSTDAPPETAKLLALCEAIRLSCRTGHGEAPRRMIEMLTRV